MTGYIMSLTSIVTISLIFLQFTTESAYDLCTISVFLHLTKQVLLTQVKLNIV